MIWQRLLVVVLFAATACTEANPEYQPPEGGVNCADGGCATCGTLNQTCCPGANGQPNKCNTADTVCNGFGSGTCKTCGHDGQPCCNANTCADNGCCLFGTCHGNNTTCIVGNRC